MTSLELRKINNYPEWNTEAGINSVIDFIQNEEIPEGLNARQQRRFEEKFGNGNWIVENIENQRFLFYRPIIANEETRINLLVSRPNDREAILREIYTNQSGYGNGINKFYNYVASKVLGIHRNETTEYLKRQGNYQITRPYQKIINSPILARSPNERWGADILNVSRYGLTIGNPQNLTGVNTYMNQRRVGNVNFNFQDSYKHILVVVDYFSKKIWAKKCRNETAEVVTQAFAEICNDSNTFPNTLQIDNGSSFLAEFRVFCDNNNIQLVTTTSYNPISNGLVERFNKELRKRIKEGIIKRNTLEWVEHLPEYLTNINSTKSSTTGFTPNELWTAGYNPLPLQALDFHNRPNDNSSRQDIIRYVETKLYKNALQQLQRRTPQIFGRNDIVRIKISTLKTVAGAEYRKRLKKKMGVSYNAITYTPTKYKIIQIFPPPPQANLNVNEPQNVNFLVRRQQYSVGLANNNPDNIPIFYPNTEIPMKFYGSDLSLVPNETRRPTINPQTIQRSRYLNRFINLPEGQQA